MSPVSRIRKRKGMPKKAVPVHWGRDLKIQRGDGKIVTYYGRRRPPRWQRVLSRLIPKLLYWLLIAALVALGLAYMASGYGLVAL